jgi:hypothetical protein
MVQDCVADAHSDLASLCYWAAGAFYAKERSLCRAFSSTIVHTSRAGDGPGIHNGTRSRKWQASKMPIEIIEAIRSQFAARQLRPSERVLGGVEVEQGSFGRSYPRMGFVFVFATHGALTCALRNCSGWAVELVER